SAVITRGLTELGNPLFRVENVVITATEAKTAPAATNIRGDMVSPKTAQPRKTATTGFTYAYVATSDGGFTESSHTYAVNATIDPKTARYVIASSELPDTVAR